MMVRNLPGLWLKIVRQPKITGRITSDSEVRQAIASVAQINR